MQENKTVLIVDDEPELREIIEFDFDTAGYEIFTAENGRQALEILKKEKIDVLVSDIVMPELNGIELVKEVRKNSDKPVFIFITGFSEYTLEDLMDMGANCLIRKPFKRRALVTLSDELVKEPADRWSKYSVIDRSSAKVIHEKFASYLDALSNHKFHLGTGGFYIATNEEYESNQLIDFDFHVGDQNFAGAGIVRWSRTKVKDGMQKGIGVEIMALKDTSSYKTYLALLKSQPTNSYVPKT